MPEATENGQVQVSQEPVVTEQITETQLQNMTGMAMAFDDPSLLPQNKPDNVVVENAANQEQSTNNTTTSTEVPSFEFKTLTDKFGWEKPEDAITEIESLRQLKDNPVIQEQKYENEESKKLHQLFLAGKIDEAVEVINTQKRIEALTSSEVTEENAGDIIKMAMQLKYKDAGLTPKEIDHKYNKQYALPKEPELDAMDEDSVAAHEQWKRVVDDINTDKIIDAKAAKIDLQSVKTKLVLPNIETNVDEGYEAYKASSAKADKDYEDIIVPAINALKETDVQLGFKVEDANNQMNFEVSLVPTKDDFDKARQNSLSVTDFLSKTCYDKDGKFLPQRLQRMILLEQNFDNYAQSIARQAVNAERARVVAKETGSNGTAGKDFNLSTEKSELQRQMEYSLS